ncbi:glycoside hydrolase family 18 protein [Cognataquiflexum aquatile]|uniref:glycoside hydrolase family 18 protein n=1 Tax=Cognataquiflexum aquatile TaxID=2249427 RepID=UPI001300548B|nr:glycoside hydrolase family 18 protein [Cognataquiflexum aquatile]
MKNEIRNLGILIFFICLLGIFFVLPNELYSQDTGIINSKIDSIPEIKIKPLKVPDVQAKKRLIHPFRKERLQNEQNRIVKLIEEHLKINPITVNEISKELMRLTMNQSFFNDYNTQNDKNLKVLESEIQKILNEQLEAGYKSEAQKESIESLKESIESLTVEMASLLQGIEDGLNKDKETKKEEIRKKLDPIRSMDFKFNPSQPSSRGESKINDSTKLLLNPKMRIFGWHDSNLNPDKVDDYNFYFLTDIIYSGYTLSFNAIGDLIQFPKSLIKDRYLISQSRNNGVNLSFSVFSNSSKNISSFLNNKESQTELIQNLKSLDKSDSIGGVNIYFQNMPIKDRNNFSAFVQDLRNEFSKDKSFLITISLPAIAKPEDKNISKIFDFSSLIPNVDYFLIHTEKLKPVNPQIPGPPSPLYSSEGKDYGSIASSLDFYNTAKILPKKLVLTVTYSGLIWDEDGIEEVEKIGLIKIRDYFEDWQSSEADIYPGFDPIQQAPYINYQDRGRGKQLWFEDDISLYIKYQYMVDRSLGGVAIWDMVSEENNLLLWNALGASLLKVDSISIKKEPIEKSTWVDYLRLYVSDLMWAAPNDIEIDTLANSLIRQKEIDRERYCMWDLFKTNDRLYSSFLKDSTKLTSDDLVDLGVKRNTILTAEDSSILISARTDIIDYLIKMRKVDGKDLYNINNPNFVKVYSQSNKNYLPWVKYETFVDSADHCTCLAIRWENYAQLHLKISIGFLFASLLIFAFVFYKTMRRGEEGFPNKALIQNIAIVLFLVSVLVFLGYLYFDIHFTYFGAASDDVPIWVLALILIFGFGLGAVYRKIIMERKYAKRDLP